MKTPHDPPKKFSASKVRRSTRRSTFDVQRFFSNYAKPQSCSQSKGE